MALAESAAIEKLHKLFPTGVIYADQYMKQTGLLSFEVHKIAKASGKTGAEWLAAHRFVWKETGYVEPDMRIRDVERFRCFSKRRLCVPKVSTRRRIYPDQGRKSTPVSKCKSDCQKNPNG